MVAAAIVNWGIGWGLIYNKALACLLLSSDICAQTQPALAGNAGIDGNGFGVPLAIAVCLWQLLE